MLQLAAPRRCTRVQPPQRRIAARALPDKTISSSRTDALRQLLRSPGIHQGPCCHDALSAKLIEQAAFPFAFMSGFCTAAARLGAPDTGLISYAEMLEQGRCVHEATVRIPVIGDGDTGYGNAMNVKRTVRGYAAVGFAGILIEDQVAPKSCGHVRGKKVVAREEAVARVRAAVDARDEGADILIVARTDARQAVDLNEALWRVQAFAEAGADVVFIDALESEAEMRAFTSLRGVAANVPKMASLLEGGKTPVVSKQALQEMGFKLVAYPLSLLGVSIRAMQRALADLADDRIPGTDALPSFGEIQDVVGFPEYFADAERYATPPPTPPLAPVPAAAPTPAAAPAPPPSPDIAPAEAPRTASGKYSADTEFQQRSTPAVEADAILEEGETLTAVIVRDAERKSDGSNGGARTPFGALGSSDSIRIVITEIATGTVKLETRLPAGWVKSLASTVPQLAGMDLEALVSSFQGRKWDKSKPIYETVANADKIRVFLEGV